MLQKGEKCAMAIISIYDTVDKVLDMVDTGNIPILLRSMIESLELSSKDKSDPDYVYRVMSAIGWYYSTFRRMGVQHDDSERQASDTAI